MSPQTMNSDSTKQTIPSSKTESTLMGPTMPISHHRRLADSVRGIKKSLSPRGKIHPSGVTFRIGGNFSPDKRKRIDLVKGFSRLALRVAVGAMAFCCLAWTSWLLLLTTKPNGTVNWVMQTNRFDNGSFWLMVDPPVAMRWLSACGLSLVAGVYISILAKIVRGNACVTDDPHSSLIRHVDAVVESLRSGILRRASGQHRFTAHLRGLIFDFLQDDSRAAKTARVWVKFGDLTVESIILYHLLEAGSPIALVFAFLVILVANALSCAIMMFLPDDHTGLSEVVVDIIFDFLIVVGYPVLTVVYCLSAFDLDQRKITINLEVFPIGYFEQNASVIADPVQTDIIYKALKSLQVFSLIDLSLRVGVHFVFSFRLYRLADVVKYPHKRLPRLYPRSHFVSAAMLVAFAVAMTVFVEKSMRTSTLACLPHPECAVKAHRWTIVEIGSRTQCPCLALIDGNQAPKTFDEWMNPSNVTTKVIQLATTGDLRTIQLINRHLPQLPEELRSCRKLRHLSLVYTHIEKIPVWFKELGELEYLYIEGTFGKSLIVLPDDMFDGMASLTFIHLGMHIHLQHLPSFDGLKSLKALALAMFVSLVELPPFDSLYNLERLVLSYVPTIETLPDLRALQHLKSFSVNSRGSWCCNGFLGPCNLQNSFCAGHTSWGVPPASCLQNKLASSATIAVVDKFATTVCKEEDSKAPGPGFPTPENIAQCDGVLYRKCSIPGYAESMCNNARFMAIFCSPDPFAIEMRRRQIQQRVGSPCNPEYEAWLGCK